MSDVRQVKLFQVVDNKPVEVITKQDNGDLISSLNNFLDSTNTTLTNYSDNLKTLVPEQTANQ